MCWTVLLLWTDFNTSDAGGPTEYLNQFKYNEHPVDKVHQDVASEVDFVNIENGDMVNLTTTLVK